MIEITNDNKEETLTDCIVEFWAPWCQPCKRQMPIVEAVEKELADVVFVKCNIDEMSDIATLYNIRSIPTIIALKDGKEVARLQGMTPRNDLIEFVAQNA